MLESMRKLMAAAAARPTSGSARAPAAATRRRAVAFLSPAHLPPRGGAGPARGAGRGGGEKPRPGAGPAAAGGGGGGALPPVPPSRCREGRGLAPAGEPRVGPVAGICRRSAGSLLSGRLWGKPGPFSRALSKV